MAKLLHPMEIIRRPLITEKGAMLASHNKYLFEVHRDANKDQVREAVQKAFDVRVSKVNIMLMKGKPRRVRSGRIGHDPDWKKAVVTLVEGDKLDLFEGI